MNQLKTFFQNIPILAISAGLGVMALLGLTLLEVMHLGAPQPTQASAPPLSETYQLKLGHNTPESTPLHQAVIRFAETVAAESNGRLQIELYPNQQLGTDHQMIEMARTGELDILLVPTAKLSVPVPAMQYPDLPFLFPSREDAYALLDGEPGQLLLQKLKQIDLLGVAFWENGFKHFTGNQFFTEPEDFVGKKFRIMKSRLIESQFNALGADAIPIDFHSTYQALKDGAIDGQENPLVAIASMDFHKVQSHLTLSKHGYLSYVFTFSQQTFTALPQDLKTLLVQTARDLMSSERQETQRQEKLILQKIKAEGVYITQLTASQRQVLAQKTAHLIQQFEPIIGSDIISATQTYLNQKYALADPTNPKLAIGLNADLSSGSRQAGLAIKRGMELAIAEINAQGGLLGKEVVLLPMDHRTLASRGQENLKKLAQQEAVIAIFGGVHSAVIMAERPLINTLKIPYLVPWATVAEITEPDGGEHYIFRASINDRIGVQKMADFAAENFKNSAIIVENSIWGRSNLQRIKKYLAKEAIPIALEVTFNRGKQNFESLVKLLQQANADSVILVANSEESTSLVKTLYQNQTLLPIISHWGVAEGNFFDQIKPLLPELNIHLLQTFSVYEQHNEVQEAFHQRYLQTYLDLDAPYATNGAAQAYDLVQLLALAVNQAQDTSPEAIRKALENLPPHQGVLKRYNPAFTAQQHDALNEDDIFIVKILPDGKQVKVDAKDSQ